jgi:hypothetical protein
MQKRGLVGKAIGLLGLLGIGLGLCACVARGRALSQPTSVQAISPPAEDLTVEEYPIVPLAEDTPDHFEYSQHIPVTVLTKRSSWRNPAPDQQVRSANRILARFGYRLAPNARTSDSFSSFDLLQGDEAVLKDIQSFHPVTVNQKGDDFAFLADDHLVRCDAVEDWDLGRHAYTAPVFAGDDLVSVEEGALTGQFTVRRGRSKVYTISVSGARVDNPVKELWSWDGHWVLEVAGQVVIDGQSLNKQQGYAEVFGWRLLRGQPFYFFKRAEDVRVCYAGRVLPNRYDEVIRYRCCEPAVFNIGGNEDMVWFHALRDGMWYYVEMGVYQNG